MTMPAKNLTVEPIGLEKIGNLGFGYESEFEDTGAIQITSLADFAAFVEFARTHETTSRSYRLTTDLDLSSLENFAGIGGTGSVNFKGTFDGGGHKISGLKISGSEDNVGLFREIGSSGLVKNLTVAGANVSGGENVGIIAGRNYGTLENCRLEGTGELVGYNAGAIKASSYEAVYLINNLDDFKAFVEFASEHETTLHNFRLTADLDLSELTDFAGIGVPDGGNDLTNFNGSFDGGGHTISNFTISGGENVGIIAGRSYGNVLNCSIGGEVTGTNNTGGVVDYNAGGVKDSSAIVTVSGGSYAKVLGNVFELAISGDAKDFIGERGTTGEVYGNYFIQSEDYIGDLPSGAARIYRLELPAGSEIISGAYKFGENYYAQAGATVTIKPAAGDYLTYSATGETLEFTGTDNETVTVGGTEKILVAKDSSGNSTFVMPEGDTAFGTETHEEIRGLKFVIEGGDGCYEISSAAELDAFKTYLTGNTGAGKTFKITADITDSNNFYKIATGNFAGTLDGGGHTLNLKSDVLTHRLTGTIKNLNVFNGGIANINKGTVTNCSAVGTSGNNTIYRRGDVNLPFKYVAGEGNDTIDTIGRDCTLKVVTADGTLARYSTETSGNDIIVHVGENTVTIKNGARLSRVNIEGYPAIDGLTFSDGAYLIRSNANLQTLATYVNGGGAIGTAENPFSGNFDGGGNIVKISYSALFGNVEGATIQNLTSNDDINISYNGTYGRLIDTVQGKAVTKIQNVEVVSEVNYGDNDSANLGGVVGFNAGDKKFAVQRQALYRERRRWRIFSHCDAGDGRQHNFHRQRRVLHWRGRE